MHLYLAALLAVTPVEAEDVHPLTKLLRSMPEVASVSEHAVTTDSKVIIHLRDWHYVDFDSFKADLQDSDAKLTSSQIRRAYRAHLRQVEAVQAEQRRVIRQLVKAGVRTVYLEGLTPEIEPVFPVICQSVCADAKPPLSALMTLPNRLSMGSAGQLLASGERLTIRGADTDESLAECNPIDESGRYRDVPARATERREDQMLRAAHGGSGNTALLLLGGGHDLTDNASALGQKHAALIVVATRKYVSASQSQE